MTGFIYSCLVEIALLRQAQHRLAIISRNDLKKETIELTVSFLFI
ncbi:hypothetical protein CHRYSEO8AT_470134 [Chryseobacterium sp. 8AT]|nr:hypothetical protein CHRYSEO8AT_470134 [Chryseobacterium sp. 8AT]